MRFLCSEAIHPSPLANIHCWWWWWILGFWYQSLINDYDFWTIWGYSHFRKPPCGLVTTCDFFIKNWLPLPGSWLLDITSPLLMMMNPLLLVPSYIAVSQSMGTHFSGIFHPRPTILGYPHLWKPPYKSYTHPNWQTVGLIDAPVTRRCHVAEAPRPPPTCPEAVARGRGSSAAAGPRGSGFPGPPTPGAQPGRKTHGIIWGFP